MNRRIRRAVGTSIIVTVCLPLFAQNTVISGVVKSASGQPVVGALVKIQSAKGLTFVVVSHEQGRYVSPDLLPAKYILQSYGERLQSSLSEPVEVGKGQKKTIDLVLRTTLQIPAREKRLTDYDYEALMPEGEGKHAVVSHCVDCHSLEPIVSSRKSREKWRAAIDRMYEDLLGRLQPMWLAMKEDEALEGLILDYLSKYFAPEVPVDPRVASQLPAPDGTTPHVNRNLPANLLQGEAGNFVEMEFSLPAGSRARDIAVDSQGTAWVSEAQGGMLGRFDAKSLSYVRITPPTGKTNAARLNSVAVDPQDRVWVADDGPNARILQYDPKSKQFKSYSIPEYPHLVPDIGAAAIATLRFLNGSVWATRMTAQRILRLDPNTGQIEEYPVPRGSVPYGLAITPDNGPWYAAEVGNLIVRVDPATGKLTSHEIPTKRSGLRALAADSEGNLWAAALDAGKVLKMDQRTGNIAEYAPPTAESGPFALDVDTKNNLVWFSETFADRIARFDPLSNRFVEFPLPEADSLIQRIEVDRSRPNRVWWADARRDRIGYIEVLESR